MSKEKKEGMKLDPTQKAMIDIAKFRETLKDKTKEELEKLEQEVDGHGDACRADEVAVERATLACYEEPVVVCQAVAGSRSRQIDVASFSLYRHSTLQAVGL